MISFNHAATGGLIGRFLPLPIALPLALASHFALDASPHYGIPHDQRDKSQFWKYFFTADFVASCGLATLAIVTHHYAVLLCGFVAAAPDLLWLLRIARTRSFDLSKHNHWFTRWHAGIQRYERPWGIYIELPVAVALFTVLYNSLV